MSYPDVHLFLSFSQVHLHALQCSCGGRSVHRCLNHDVSANQALLGLDLSAGGRDAHLSNRTDQTVAGLTRWTPNCGETNPKVLLMSQKESLPSESPIWMWKTTGVYFPLP